MAANVPIDGVAKQDGANVTIVGSIAELAALLGGMTQEQLNNVQLDPALLDLLHQTFGLTPEGHVLVDQPAYQYPGVVGQLEPGTIEAQHTKAQAEVVAGKGLENGTSEPSYLDEATVPVEAQVALEGVVSFADMLAAGQGLVDLTSSTQSVADISKQPMAPNVSLIEQLAVPASQSHLVSDSAVAIIEPVHEPMKVLDASSATLPAQTLADLAAQLLCPTAHESLPNIQVENVPLPQGSSELVDSYLFSNTIQEPGFVVASLTPQAVEVSSSASSNPVVGSSHVRGLLNPILRGIPRVNINSASLMQTMPSSKVQHPRDPSCALQPVISSPPVKRFESPYASKAFGTLANKSSATGLAASKPYRQAQSSEVVQGELKGNKFPSNVGQGGPKVPALALLAKPAGTVTANVPALKVSAGTQPCASKTSLFESKSHAKAILSSPLKATRTTELLSSTKAGYSRPGSTIKPATVSRTSLVIGSGPNAKQILLSPEQLEKLMQAQPGQKVVCVVKQKSSGVKEGISATDTLSTIETNPNALLGLKHSGVYTLKRADLEKVVSRGLSTCNSSEESLRLDSQGESKERIAGAMAAPNIPQTESTKKMQVLKSHSESPRANLSSLESASPKGDSEAGVSGWKYDKSSNVKCIANEGQVSKTLCNSPPHSSDPAIIKKGAVKRKGLPTSLAAQDKKQRKVMYGENTRKSMTFSKITSGGKRKTSRISPGYSTPILSKSKSASSHLVASHRSFYMTGKSSQSRSGTVKRDRPLPKKFDDFDMSDSISRKKLPNLNSCLDGAALENCPSGNVDGKDVVPRRGRGRPRKIRVASSEASIDGSSFLLLSEQSDCTDGEPCIKQAVVTVERLPHSRGISSPPPSCMRPEAIFEERVCGSADKLRSLKKQRLAAPAKRGRRKSKKNIQFVGEKLPEHLKKKPKASAHEDAIIDLSKVQLKSPFAEKSFTLPDMVSAEAAKLFTKRSWVCSLCGKPAYIGNLDVLFGPYKLRIAGLDESSSPAKDKKKNLAFAILVWLHRDCAIWTPNICLIGQVLHGLGETLEVAANSKCALCSQIGATLSCGDHGCRELYHYVCARQRGCCFNEDTFTMVCPKHR